MKIDRRHLIAATIAASTGASAAQAQQAAEITPLPRPASGHIRVAFVIDAVSNIMDAAGPWETFNSAGSDAQHFERYTVSPVREAHLGGIAVTPHYTLDDAPQPHVIVMGAQQGNDAAKVEWIQRMAPGADLVMSICTGAFLLARTGLIDGRAATTHHDYYESFEQQFPNVRLVRNRRFVDNGKFVSGGGLTSGVDAALHIVARYFGVGEAELVAAYLEHYSDGWRTGVRV
jgi:transcriptional regulator GlxA family with amidase domain